MRARRGSGLYEFFVLVAVLGTLALVLLSRLDAAQAEAERLEVELTVRNIRVGIQLAIGELIMHGEEGRMAELAQRSPVEFLGRTPRGYGVGQGIAAAPGEWRWDAAQRRLSYQPHHPAAFAPSGLQAWRLVLRTDGNGRANGLSFFNDVH